MAKEEFTMLRPAISQIITKNESYYSLVIAVAKRARQIATDLYDNGQTLEKKPVKQAVEEFAAGRYKLVEPPKSSLTSIK